MSEYRIICVTTEGPHKHITEVGIGVSATVPNIRYDIDKVFEMMDGGETFITRSAVTRMQDNVRRQPCGNDGCTTMTLKSGPKAHADQIVEALAACPEQLW